MGTQDLIGAITGNLSQNDRLITLDTKLGSNILVPQRVVGHSRLGRHFEFTIDVVSTWATSSYESSNPTNRTSLTTIMCMPRVGLDRTVN